MPHRVSLIGWPVEHSLSPAMQNAAFAALGLDWEYVLLPVPPGEVASAVQTLAARGFRGANVTVPYKETVIPHLSRLTEAARAIGAVNTIVVEEDGSLTGENTDWTGFLAALRESGFEPQGRGVLLLGAGGAARAVAYALARAGARVVLLNRTPERAKMLVRDLSPAVPAGSLGAGPLEPQTLDREASRADLLVNATSVGMWPRVEESPWPGGLPVPAHLVVFDLVYNPLETALLRQAREAGARTVNGLGMLVHQGALAFERWTGRPAPLEVMRAVCYNSLMKEIRHSIREDQCSDS
mgnify:CR=1 FL=1|jgi:shikimate dehydrogenase